MRRAVDIRPHAVQEAEVALQMTSDHYHDGGTWDVTDEQAQADGFLDADEVREMIGEALLPVPARVTT